MEFPKLPDNGGAIDFQDWLYLVEQQVGSMASGALTWWMQVNQAVTKAYADYQASSPIHRLTVKVDLPADLEDAKYKKLEKRVSALLVASIPQSMTMKEEMIAYRVQRIHQQLFRLMVNYQPGAGGVADRAQVLKQLEVKDGTDNVTETLSSLRKWYRWLQRADVPYYGDRSNLRVFSASAEVEGPASGR